MGLKGIRFDGHPGREAMDTVLQLGIPVMYYPKLGTGAGPARHYHMLAEAYPRVKFILPHLGMYRSLTWWAHVEAIDLAKRHANIYLDTSGIGSLKYLEMAAAELPTDRLLFGTSAPELDPRVEREAVRLLKLGVDREEKGARGQLPQAGESVMSHNRRQLYSGWFFRRSRRRGLGAQRA